jgi:hypothetical protein
LKSAYLFHSFNRQAGSGDYMQNGIAKRQIGGHAYLFRYAEAVGTGSHFRNSGLGKEECLSEKTTDSRSEAAA